MTAPLWRGVVMVERDPQRLTARVSSARSIVLAGHRAIGCHVPYSMVKHYFLSDDKDHLFVSAELYGDGVTPGHLEFFERSTIDQWADTAHTALPPIFKDH
jgi:hypothetical protein